MSRARIAAATLLATGLCVTAGASASSPTHLPEKQALLAHQLAVPDAAAPPAPKDPSYRPPYDPPEPQIALRQVTANDVQAPVAPSVFAPTTQWVDVVDGVQIALYGGAAVERGGSAAIYVWITDLQEGRDLPGTDLFVDDAVSGLLTLTGVSEETVSYRSPRGHGTFDLATHTFTDD